MRKRFLRFGCLVAAGGAFVLGCQSGPKGYPSGPLLSSKQPVAGKTGSEAPVQVADAEPRAPQLPATALAALPPDERDRPAALGLPTGSVRPNESSADAAPAASSPFRTAGRSRGPVTATPAVRSSEGGETPVGPALERKVAGQFGHGDDYSWLQGVLEKHYRGRLYLRYCDPSTEDTHGGKVCLDHDPVLAQFKDGDVIHVEGSMAAEKDPTRHEGWKHFPQYRIRSAKLIEHKE